VIVECPACHTRYRTDGAGVVDENTFFECSQETCKHVFPYSSPLLQVGESEVPFPVSSPTAPRPSFSLPRPTEGTPLDTTPSRPFAPVAPPVDEPFEELEDFSPPETPFFAEGEGENDSQAILSRPESAPPSEIIFPLRPFFVFLGLLVSGYAILGWYCLSHLADAEAALARLPLLGSVFTTERFSGQQIALTGLQGRFWLTKDNRRVFAVSGKAVNDASVPARSIQIEGVIYDPGGRIVGQRVIFCGTETAARVLESLTAREIGILQNLVPPKQFNVPAGQAVNFLLVFTSPPPTIAEFSCRVIAAQFGSP